MVVSSDHRLLVLDNETSLFTDDVMDFWRPNYAAYPMVDGKFSNEQYIRFFAEVWNDYQAKQMRSSQTLTRFVSIYHIQKWG